MSKRVYISEWILGWTDKLKQFPMKLKLMPKDWGLKVICISARHTNG